MRVGSISGSFLYDLTLENLVVRDTSGELLADLPRVRVAYRLPNFIAGQVVLSAMQLDSPTIQLIKHRNGRMNYEEVLGIGKGSKGGKSPLVEFHNVKMTGRDAPDRAAVESAPVRPDREQCATRRSRPSGPSRAGSWRRVPRDSGG